MAFTDEGFSRDELLAIGTRKVKLDLTMSATDINAAIPYEVSQHVITQMGGSSENELRDLGERRMPMIAMPDTNTTGQGIPQGNIDLVSNVLDNIKTFFRSKGAIL